MKNMILKQFVSAEVWWRRSNNNHFMILLTLSHFLSQRLISRTGDEAQNRTQHFGSGFSPYHFSQHTRANPAQLLHLPADAQQQTQMHTQRSDVCARFTAHPENTCNTHTHNLALRKLRHHSGFNPLHTWATEEPLACIFYVPVCEWLHQIILSL